MIKTTYFRIKLTNKYFKFNRTNELKILLYISDNEFEKKI